jgi:alkaline phosphatase
MKTGYHHKNTSYSRLLIFLVVCGLVLASLPIDQARAAGHSAQAKYVFLFIGDGLGLPQRMAAAQYAQKPLVMDTLPAQGITTTHAADRFITGSAASSTALAAGTKTNIGMIGMTPDQRHVRSVAAIAKEKGLKVGIVSSVSIDHATPAAFYAHVPKRSQYYDIDVAIAESGFDFFGGGGLKDPANKKDNSTSFKGNALEIIQKAGYRVVDNKDDFEKLSAADGKVLAYNAWLQDSKALPYAMDMTDEDISLPEFTAKAIEMLDNPNGFFLMVEGGKIDWACHANDAAASIHNTLAFDKSVEIAMNFARKHAEETLIVVTGDHECGGLTLGFAGTKYASHFDILSHQKVSFTKFTEDILAGYKKEKAGAYNLDDIKPVITEHFGLKFEGDPSGDQLVLTSAEIGQVEEAFMRSLVGKKAHSKNQETYLLYGGYDPLTVTLTHILNQKAGLGWTSYKHTGVPVSTSAAGVQAESFNGYYDNTDVALKIMTAMGIDSKIHYAGAAPQVSVAAQ